MPPSTYINGCHVVILIKPKNWIKSNKSHDLPPLHLSRTPWALEGPRTREKSSPLHAVVLSEFRRRSTSACPAGPGVPEVVVLHRTCVNTWRCYCSTRHRRHSKFVTILRSATLVYIDNYTLSVYKRYVTDAIPLPYY